MKIDLRAALLGRDGERSVHGVVAAVGVSVLVLVVSFLPFAVGAVVEPGLVLVGFGLASWWAYDNSGLAVSVLLTSGPVGVRLAYYWWLYRGQPAPVALPLSFGGAGAWEMWVPLALVLGVVAFGAGVVLRRGLHLATRSSRSVT